MLLMLAVMGHWEPTLSDVEPFVFCCIDYASESCNVSTQMPSSESHEELETLLNMEMKLRLLDLENITIPETPPQVPAEPPNFNFVYDFS